MSNSILSDLLKPWKRMLVYVGLSALVVLVILVGFLLRAHAADCPASLKAAKAATGSGLVWTEVKPKAFFFLEGVFAMNPETPAGLPTGADHAYVVIAPVEDTGMIVFAVGRDSGEKVCAVPMNAPKELVKLIAEVENGPGDPL